MFVIPTTCLTYHLIAWLPVLPVVLVVSVYFGVAVLNSVILLTLTDAICLYGIMVRLNLCDYYASLP